MYGVLDGKGRLVGYAAQANEGVYPDESGRIEVPDDCDLPINGSYTWDGNSFIPSVAVDRMTMQPPITDQYAIYLLVVTMTTAGMQLPGELIRWAEWFHRSREQRANEQTVVDRRKRTTTGPAVNAESDVRA